MTDYTVQPGDCLCSIAKTYHTSWQDIWKHASNADLRKKRADPNILAGGDIIHIPDIELKQQPALSNQRHQFKRQGVPTRVHLQLMIDDTPRKGEEYILTVTGVATRGHLDSQGRLNAVVPCDAGTATLLVGKNRDKYELNLGALQDAQTVTGIQSRLNNLGFFCGDEDGVVGPKTQAALRAFQAKNSNRGLDVSGKIDSGTVDALTKAHGC
ncbi:MAG: peptidoglycan-binding protein [Tepidisphaeraceae bacterium]|jgi:N-acetylmuramoyl-L-alanine amidase